MSQFHVMIKSPKYSTECISWGDMNDYYTFRSLMEVLGIRIYNYDGLDCNNSGVLYFKKDEWSNGLEMLKNYDSQDQTTKISLLPFFDHDAFEISGMDEDSYDACDFPTLQEIIEYMEYALKHSPKRDDMICLAWY